MVWIAAVLADDQGWLELAHHGCQHGFDAVPPGFIIGIRCQGHVNNRTLPAAPATIGDQAGSWEQGLGRLMEGDSDHAWILIECKFDTVTVVHIKVDIQDSWESRLTCSTDPYYQIVVDTKPTGSAMCGVVEATRWIEGTLELTADNLAYAVEGCASNSGCRQVLIGCNGVGPNGF